MAMLPYSTILGLFPCIVGLALGFSASNSEVVYSAQCAPTSSPVCFVHSLTFVDRSANLMLKDAADKTTLNIKGGKIEALLPKHCKSLPKFEKLLIGRVGLQELCFTTSFVVVNAEHNRLKKLHEELPFPEGTTYRLQELRLNHNQLETVDGICKFVALKELHLERNLLSTLDMSCFAEMKQLKKLHLANNRLNMITTPISELSLPALSSVGLQNNTLTELDLHKWTLPVLEVLELSSNNLTNVRGLENFQMLSDISLAVNNWNCDELDRMLEALEANSVLVKDGDHKCSGIRNGTICCTQEQLPSEGSLLDELNKFSELKQRYDDAESMLDKVVTKKIEEFNNQITQLKEQHAKRDKAPAATTQAPNDSEENPQEEPAPPPAAAKCECICSKDRMDELELKLTELQKGIGANNVTLQALRDNQSQVSYMALLTKHEFRTAVKRGEYKLKELNSMLSMLREHIKQKQTQH